MSTNCIKTNLKGIVNNNDLQKLGTIVINIASGNTGRLTIKKADNDSQIVARVVGDGYIAKSSADLPSSTSKELTYTTSDISYVYYNSDVSRIELVGKYNLWMLRPSRGEFDLAQFSYVPLKDFVAENNLGITGNIANLKQAQLEKFSVSECANIYGSLNSIDLSALTYLSTKNTPITLDLHIADLGSITYLWVGADSNTSELKNVVTGSLSDFSNSPDLEELRIIYNTVITGSIASDLGSLKKLKVLNLNGATGIALSSVEDFVSAQYTAGRTSVATSEPVQIRYGGRLTFGNVTLNASYNFLTSENASKIAIYYGASTLENCTTVYCKGYGTQQEAEAAFPGKTVTRVDA